MEKMKLTKEKFNDFIAALEKERLYAPQKEGETTKVLPVTKENRPDFTVSNTTVPLKSFFFPQTETLFQFNLGQTDMKLPSEEEKAVVLGIRPCDAKSLTIVDKLFSWDVDDPYYLKKRAQTTLVGLACNKPCANCFCTSLGGSPASIEGLDVLMTELEDGFLLDPVTEKGTALCQSVQELLAEASEEDSSQAEAIHKEARESITRQIDAAGIPEKLPGLWENKLWQEISDSCLGCGICTYLCPTCHCFDMQDEVEGIEGRRCRTWDSCMFGEYTMHASGHNPRPTRRERTRNRINHKYSYFVDKFGEIACVGCGRCINRCPVNIDILDNLAQVREASL